MPTILLWTLLVVLCGLLYYRKFRRGSASIYKIGKKSIRIPIPDWLCDLLLPKIVYSQNNGVTSVALRKDYFKAKRSGLTKDELKDGTPLVFVKPLVSYVSSSTASSHDLVRAGYLWYAHGGSLHLNDIHFSAERVPDLYVAFSRIHALEEDRTDFPRENHDKWEAYMFSNGRKKFR